MDEEAILATTRPLLNPRPPEEHTDSWNEDGDYQDCVEESVSASSSVTFMVVFSTLVSVCGSFVFGNAAGYSSPVEAGIVDELGLTTTEYSVFSSILTVGGMFGAVLSGRIADLLGRKGTMGVSEIFCILGWTAIILAEDAFWLDLGRFSLGCGIGVLSYVVPVYIAEIAPRKIRGSCTSLNQLMIGLGKAITFLIGSLVNWRTLAITGTVPCVIHLLGLLFIPESPRWLAKVGRGKELESSLRRLRGMNANILQEMADIQEYTHSISEIPQDGIVSLFQWKYAYALTVGIGLMGFQELGGLNAFAFYASEMFDTTGFSSTTGTIAASVVQIIMATLGVILIDKSGRRPLLLISAVGICLGCILTGLAFLFQDLRMGKELISVFVFLGVLVFLGSFEFGMGGIPWIIMSEIFPINIKGSAGSIVTLVNWFGSWVTAFTFNFLFDWSSAGTFLIYAIISGGSVVFIAKLVPETKGRTLEDIQLSIINRLQ